MRFLIVVLGASILVSGCVSLKPPTAAKSYQHRSSDKRQQQAANIRQWTVNGAFSIARSQQKPVLANYSWQQKNLHSYDIRVFSPLDLFNLLIVGRVNSVVLWKSASQLLTATTPEALLQREMGWSLPIRNMYYWIRGVVAPGDSSKKFDQYGHLIRLKQQGWSLQLSHYISVQGVDVPGKLIMSRPSIQITVVMRGWRFPFLKTGAQ